MITPLTRTQQRTLAALVIDALANLAEYPPDCLTAGECDDAHPEAIRAQLATWARRLPGDAWDIRLDEQEERASDLIDDGYGLRARGGLTYFA